MLHYLKLLTGKLKVKSPGSFSFRNVLAVLQSYFRKSKMISGFNLPIHIYEQIIFRRFEVSVKSPECWNKGYCIHCGCIILDKTLEDRGCSSENPCYPDMMNKENWEAYKRINNIKYFE